MLDVNVTTDADIPHLLAALSAVSCEAASAILSSMPFDLEQRRGHTVTIRSMDNSSDEPGVPVPGRRRSAKCDRSPGFRFRS